MNEKELLEKADIKYTAEFDIYINPNGGKANE